MTFLSPDSISASLTIGKLMFPKHFLLYHSLFQLQLTCKVNSIPVFSSYNLSQNVLSVCP